MLSYIIRRLLWGLSVVLVVTFAVFFLFGPVMQWRSDVDPARIYAGKNPSAQEIEQVSKTLGLDRPYYVQYAIMLRRLVFGPSAQDRRTLCPGASTSECAHLVGHLGQSFEKRRSVDSLIWERVGVTMSLTLVAACIWMLIAVPLGMLAALRPRSIVGRLGIALALVGEALPVYFIGLLCLYFLAYTNKWFPDGGYAGFELTNPWPWLSHLLLPAFALSLSFAALYARLVRDGMSREMGEHYVRTAHAKGSGRAHAVTRHAMRNAMLPVITLFGLDLGLLLGGAVLAEATFGLPGLGQLSVEAATRLDVPTTSGVVLFGACVIVVANLVVDLVLAIVDPRIRLS